MLIVRFMCFFLLGLLAQAHDSHDLKQNIKLKKSRSKKGRRKNSCIRCESLLFSSVFPSNAHRFLEESQMSSSKYGDDFVVFDSNPDDDFVSVISDFSDFVYENDDLRCLLLSMVKNIRELISSSRDLNDDVADRSFSNDKNDIEHDEALSEEIDISVDDTSHLFILGHAKKSTSDIVDPFLIASSIHHDSEGRKLMSNRFADIDEQAMLWNAKEKILKRIPSAEDFFTKCKWYGIGKGPCLLLFALSRTIDASICHYVQEKGCKIENDCTATLKFRTTFNSRMISQSFPFLVPIFGAVINDISAPCGRCIQADHKCSALCNFADGYDKRNIDSGLSF